MDEPEIEILTNACIQCNMRSIVKVNAFGYQKYKAGANIQDAFPTLTPDEREMIQTGIHPGCWEKMWAGAER